MESRRAWRQIEALRSAAAATSRAEPCNQTKAFRRINVFMYFVSITSDLAFNTTLLDTLAAPPLWFLRSCTRLHICQEDLCTRQPN